MRPQPRDTTEVVPSCGAAALLEHDRECNDYTVDFFLRMDSFPESNGRKTDCTLPDAGGRFTCHAYSGHAYSGHAWEGVVDPKTGRMVLGYAFGVPFSSTDLEYEGIAGLESIDCELRVELRLLNPRSDWLDYIGVQG
ncbi:MAG: hypothetical protein P1V51_24895 [Deltaproteobacteria bacterium]|nr:hypothetical protein [Deltaproteobacteria bacterium]